jgi:hypothetical protein
MPGLPARFIVNAKFIEIELGGLGIRTSSYPPDTDLTGNDTRAVKEMTMIEK